MPDVTLAAKVFAALFAIMSPLSTVPIFLTLTDDMAASGRRATVIALVATVAIGSLVCALAGEAVLGLFGIDVTHFRLAGGLIVMTIALSMLQADAPAPEPEQHTAQAHDNPGIYPLGLPLTLGPGAMATIIVFAQAAHGSAQVAGFYAGLFGYLAFFAVTMALAPVLGARLSHTALSISKRIMGIILAAIAMEMVGGALGTMFPGLLR